MNPPKTLEEHRRYLQDIVGLMLWYVHSVLRRDGSLEFRRVLEERVDVFRKTSFNRGLLNPADAAVRMAGPEWGALAERLEGLYRRHRDDAAAFEAAALLELRPLLDERSVCDWIDVSRINGYQCGSLRYQEPSPGDDARPVRTIFFHVANALQPESMFSDPKYLCACFGELMRQTELRFGSRELATSTWLNSCPKWLRYFPQGYLDSLTPEDRDVKWHYGFWGQFITARGTFNEEYGRRFRQTGRMPYYPRAGHCPFEEMREHLARSFGVRFGKDGWML